MSSAGRHNLAPYSQFQNLTWDPPMVMVAANCKADGTPKDTTANAIETGEFVWNMATFDLKEHVVMSSHPFPPEVDEFQELGIRSEKSRLVKPLRVADSPVHFECKLRQHVFIPCNTPEANTYLLIGEVIGVHIKDEFIGSDGILDILKIRPLARIGYLDYIAVDSKFQVIVPNTRKPEVVPYLRETAASK